MELIAEKRGALEIEGTEIYDEHIELVNQFSQVPLQRNEVYISSVYLCNDIIDAYASRFTKQALEQICQLIVGESVLKGHQHNSLPIARVFKANIERQKKHKFVRIWFYWLKDDKGTELANNILLGKYRELSTTWRYQTATCSICKQDIRKCPHIPGDYYEGELCYYEMTNVKEVLEGSLVKDGKNRKTEPTESIDSGKLHEWKTFDSKGKCPKCNKIYEDIDLLSYQEDGFTRWYFLKCTKCEMTATEIYALEERYLETEDGWRGKNI